ncbi:hypothetical protein PHYSODRAFT_307749 [Phytophthora sojae]|uniref:Uncharacterized protein n=1 Tax=Phytophthora sojae (strain P6497) TaxID=1094619 RepID=G5AFX3_PHYSP|nr:hypothetical protein PHYSODRAFT_307749 [Phytophthora sojae]EGZ05489.1 hypothetical protein PHYSODRAFT_307749 [Phytophthora sojae]|eukprot:XP_009539020.1 hypothetical protein PHYSODRAFT_307749 [Phytophthora sojae]
MGNAWCHKDDSPEKGDDRVFRNEDPPTEGDQEDTDSDEQDTRDAQAANNNRNKRRDRGLKMYDSCDDVWMDRMWLYDLDDQQTPDAVASGHDCGDYCGDHCGECDLECHDAPDCSDCGDCWCD